VASRSICATLFFIPVEFMRLSATFSVPTRSFFGSLHQMASKGDSSFLGMAKCILLDITHNATARLVESETKYPYSLRWVNR
jgi:hypothetical protein